MVWTMQFLTRLWRFKSGLHTVFIGLFPLCALALYGCPRSSARLAHPVDASDLKLDGLPPFGESVGADGFAEFRLGDAQGKDGHLVVDNQDLDVRQPDGHPLGDDHVPDAACSEDHDCIAIGPCMEAVCVKGKCVDVSKDCDDGDPCTLDSCDEQTGSCIHEPVLDPTCCVPNCNGKECSPDGCGGKCGECGDNQVCTADGVCCTPKCDGVECGPDGCGGQCGQCDPGELCYLGECLKPGCQPMGQPGCNGCPCEDCVCEKDPFCCVAKWDKVCVQLCIECGWCGASCVPNCEGKECGPDGCNGTCGDCPPGQICTAKGVCVDCVPDCGGKECGDDGCGGNCGVCNDGNPSTIDICVAGTCSFMPLHCVTNKDCDDGSPCTAEACIGGKCKYWDTGLCCNTNKDCDDFNVCTLDQCKAGLCKHIELSPCSYCGDGICSAGEEGTCYKDCNPPEPGCLPVGPVISSVPGPGCNGCECESCVCSILPSCCTTAWALHCVTACKELCGGCGGPTKCGNAICDEEEDCETCPQDCGDCSLPTCGNGICQPWKETCYTCPLDCGSCTGLMVSTLPTCGGCLCEWCVCSQKPSCCSEAWTLECVLLCPECGGPGAYCGDGVCSSSEQGPGCPEDCGKCNDGFCGPLEDELNCPEDCGYCGDGYCATNVKGTNNKETEWNCPKDCVVNQ